MKILVTGAKGFVGRNLVENLKNIRDGKNRTRPALQIDEIFEYDLNSTAEELDIYCREADFVFNLAGVNRPKILRSSEKGILDLLQLCLIHWRSIIISAR